MSLRFSIVTPVLNGMPSLRGCVGSVRRQTCADWEHLIEDGGSGDGTVDWLKSQPGLNWRSSPDAGMYDAINRGWKRSSGDILSWLNSDEQYLPAALETVREEFERRPDADAIYGDYLLVKPDGTPTAARREIPLRKWYAVNGALYVQSCALFVRRRVFEQFGGFDTSFKIIGDKEWVLRLLSRGVRFCHVSHYLGIFCLTGRNLSLRPDAMAESQRVFRMYGAHRLYLLRRTARAARCIEKALRGCYGRQTVSFRFTKDESGAGIDITGTVGTRWIWHAEAGERPFIPG